MTLRETLSQAINGRGVTAEIYYDEGPEVEVKIIGNAGYGAQSHWRITGTKSAGDYDTHYIEQTDATSGSFEAENGHKYALQAVWGNPGISNGAFFTVNFDDDSGGDSGGGGGVGNTYNTLYVNQGEGTELHVRRNWPTSRTCWEDLYTGEQIYWDGEDTFYFESNALEGYNLDYYSFNGKQLGYMLDNFYYYQSDGTYDYYQLQSNRNASVTSTATPKEYTLSINQDVGCTLTVKRIGSKYSGAAYGILNNGDKIWHYDVLKIDCEPISGYQVSKINVGAESIFSGDLYTVSGGTVISAVSSVLTRKLSLNPDTKSKIVVNRVKSPLKGAEIGLLASAEDNNGINNIDIYYSDELEIIFTSNAEYKIAQQLVNGEYFTSGGTYIVTDENIDIVTITELSGLAHISNGSTFDDYVIYIFNGQDWNDQYIPHVFDGTDWVICS